jgi:MFS family permease
VGREVGSPAQPQGLRKLGLDFGLISGAEWLIIIGGFMGTFLMLFYQTSIGTLATAFGMNSFEVGVGFALFMLAFAAAAFLMHRFKPSQLRLVEIISLVLLGSTMPLYAIIKGVGPAYTLMTLDGFIVGVMIDSFMTMSGMASLDPSRRQVEQAAFAFWPALAPIIAPLITGMLLKLGIIKIFTFFSIMAFAAIPFVLALRGKYALQYVERKTEKTEERVSISSLFKNRQFNWAFVAALGFTIPFYALMSFGVRYGQSIGFSPSQVFYLFTLMFTFNLLTRLYILIKSPIQNKYPYMLAALSFATLTAVFLYASYYVHTLYYLAFVFAGIPYGIVWPLGLQIANTTFKSSQIASATSFFSSAMMIMSAIMPAVGLLASDGGFGFAGAFLMLEVVTVAFLLAELVLRPRNPEEKAIP